MKKHLKKLWPLPLLMALFMLTNCSEELDVVTKGTPQQKSGSSYKLLIGGPALEPKERLFGLLERNSGRGLEVLQSAIAKDGNVIAKEDIESLIDYSMVYMIENTNGVTNYAFRFDHPAAAPDKFFNLVLKTKGDSNKVMMTSYSLDKSFADEYESTGSLANFTGFIHFDLVVYDADFPCIGVPNFPVPIQGGTWLGPGHNSGGGNQDGPGPGPGPGPGNTGGDSPGNTPGPTTPPPAPPAIEVDVRFEVEIISGPLNGVMVNFQFLPAAPILGFPVHFLLFYV